MNNRKLDRENDLEYQLEKKIITGLRSVFMAKEEFTFSPNMDETKVVITSAYPDKDCDFKVPQIVFTDASYSIGETSLCGNYESDIIKEKSDGVVIGKRFVTTVPYNVNIMCLATKLGIAKDLANRVVNIIKFEGYELFNNYMALNINSVTKNGSGEYRTATNNANTIFQSSINISGIINWSGYTIYNNPVYLRNIEYLMKVCNDENDFEEPYDINDYKRIW